MAKGPTSNPPTEAKAKTYRGTGSLTKYDNIKQHVGQLTHEVERGSYEGPTGKPVLGGVNAARNRVYTPGTKQPAKPAPYKNTGYGPALPTRTVAAYEPDNVGNAGGTQA